MSLIGQLLLKVCENIIYATGFLAGAYSCMPFQNSLSYAEQIDAFKAEFDAKDIVYASIPPRVGKWTIFAVTVAVNVIWNRAQQEDNCYFAISVLK